MIEQFFGNFVKSTFKSKQKPESTLLTLIDVANRFLVLVLVLGIIGGLLGHATKRQQNE